MNRICIKNAKAVLPDGLRTVNIISEDGNIIEISDNVPKEYEAIDAKGQLVTPGFIETHVHGGGGSDFCDATAESFQNVVKTHLSHGTTLICPTAMSCKEDMLYKFFDAYRETKNTPIGEIMYGIHLEGPYLNPKMCGAQRPDIIRNPGISEVERLFDAGSDIICRITAAPEIEGVEYLAKKAVDNGILLSIGHSDATAEEAIKAIDMGFSHVTHMYSATTTVRKINQRVCAGINEVAYLYDDYNIELIGDGRHVAKETMQMAVKIKGADKINLTGDSMRAAGQIGVTESYLGDICPENRVIIDDDVAKLPDMSVYAGSIATMDKIFKNAVVSYEIPVEKVVTMLSTTPAKIIGADNYGEISIGKRCDILIWNEDFSLNKIIVGGKLYEI